MLSLLWGLLISVNAILEHTAEHAAAGAALQRIATHQLSTSTEYK